MNKKLIQSKTVWGFGVVGIIALAGTFGVDVASNTYADVLQILAGLLGVYGIRDAI